MAIASLDLLHETRRASSRSARLERWLASGLEPLRALPIVGDVRVIGGVGIVELVSDKATKSGGRLSGRHRPALTQAFLDRGLLLRPLGNVLYVMPPYVITEAETRWLAQQIRDVIAEVTRT